ncbi:sulfite exporter TauE/SafE family protein [Opitutaceae bacterium EW11]|nr:sulfite exporter TauE/SafE family protein [Opitutaceae bacterium EW11]
MNLEPWQWAIAVGAALLVGISKTGVSGLGMLAVVVFTLVIPSTKQSTGIVLPLLIMGDAMAVASYRRHTRWSYLWRLFPWTALGVLLGYLALGRIDDRQARVLIGGIVCAMVAMHVWRKQRTVKLSAGASKVVPVPAIAGRPEAAGSESAPPPQPSENPEAEHPVWFAPLIGVLAGFTTLVSNAAGPLMAIYLLAMGLPKMEFMGTGAVFFMLLNWFKVPFMVHLGLITGQSFTFNLLLAPAVILGTFIGRWLLQRIDQRLFEWLALLLSAAAGIKLLL